MVHWQGRLGDVEATHDDPQRGTHPAKDGSPRQQVETSESIALD
jgi:hypothetical protein